LTDPYLSLVARAVTLSDYGMVLSDPNVGTFYLFAISSPGVYGIITVGRSSRAAVQSPVVLKQPAQPMWSNCL
jgi:NADH:ubiquinone oxidoreductase subunit H